MKNESQQDAVALLTADHAEVRKLFKQFASLKDKEDREHEKAQVVAEVCRALTLHADLEEELIYPAARETIDNDDLVDEAEVEHQSAKILIGELEAMEPGDPLYNAKMTVLSEQIEHHVKEEEGEMFPRLKKSRLDLKDLGAVLKARKAELSAIKQQKPNGRGRIAPAIPSKAKPAASSKGARS